MQRPLPISRLLLVMAMLSASPSLSAQQQQEQELADLKQQIKLTEQQVKKQQQQLEQAEQKLRLSDKALAEVSSAQHSTEQEHQALVTKQQALLAEQSSLEQSLTQQQALLASQLKSAYSLGQHDYTKLLLNQQDAGKLERVLSYYQYVNRARMTQLANLNQTISQLQQVLQQLDSQQQQLTQLLAKLQQQQAQLALAKNEQKQSVSRLSKTLQQQGRQLDYLRQNENSLQTTIDQLRKLAEKSRELTGLLSQKGRLSWPLTGNVLQQFGESRQGGISSRGVVIKATEGESVKAIADGQVIYADWLKGYGWVIVLDHGEGFMSLYGHNQNLLKQPGARISAGETIAQAGMSGGQAMSGLYFEIRNKGEAVNPLQWLNTKKR